MFHPSRKPKSCVICSELSPSFLTCRTCRSCVVCIDCVLGMYKANEYEATPITCPICRDDKFVHSFKRYCDMLALSGEELRIFLMVNNKQKAKNST